MSGTPTPRFGRALRLFMPVVVAALFVVPFVGSAKVKDHPKAPKGAANVVGAPATDPAQPSDNSAADPGNDNAPADPGNAQYSAASVSAPAAQPAGPAITYSQTASDDHGKDKDKPKGDDKGKGGDKPKGDDKGKGDDHGKADDKGKGHDKGDDHGKGKDKPKPGPKPKPKGDDKGKDKDHGKGHGKGHGDDAGNNAPSSTPASAPALTSTPSTTRHVCTSRRSVTLRLDRGYRVRAATVMVNGKVIRVRYGRHVTATVSLRGQARGTYTVRAAVLTKGGRVRIQTRRYMTCAVKRLPARKPR